MLDYAVKSARIVDGTGKPSFVADLGIEGGKIVRIGTVSGEVRTVIDGGGLTVCPGFIDMHTHMDIALLGTPFPDAKIRQGVTTDVLGQDGLGTFPVSERNRDMLAGLLSGLNGDIPREKWTWGGAEGYACALEEHGIPSNAVLLASHGPVRIEAMGMENRSASDAELDKMRNILSGNLKEGAFGLSTGLIYPPCSYADENELGVLIREVGRKNGVFVVHMRDEGYHLLRSIEEVARICLDSGAKLHISHFEAYGKVNWHLMDHALEKLEGYMDRGLSVSWDRYPYLAGCTVLSAVLPGWAFNEGPDALVRNLADPSFRARIHSEFEKGLDVWHNRQISVGWENIVVTSVQSGKNRWMQGLSCVDIAAAEGKNPIDAVCDLLSEEKLAVTMISFYGSGEVLEKILTHSRASVGSDGIYGGRPHPRLYGTFPKFIRDFCLDSNRLSLEAGVRKITSFPAEILGISDRGIIAEGYRADLVLFDPCTLRDTGTYENPEQYPEGIKYVFVNGTAVVAEKGCTGALPGKVLRKR